MKLEARDPVQEYKDISTIQMKDCVNKKDRQYTYKVTVFCFCITIVAVETQQ
jgi:hypothetical protein